MLTLARLAGEIGAALRSYADELGYAEAFRAPSEEQLVQLQTYLEILQLWRTRLSLISVEDPQLVVREHVVDSLALLPWVEDGRRVADLGSGGGFPGVPLAIFRPGVAVTLIESRRKRASFLSEVARRLNLANVVVLPERGEDAASRGVKFDLTVCRAFAAIGDILKVALPLTNAGGTVIAMKAELAPTEREQVPRHSAIGYHLPTGKGRQLVVMPVP
ncbi:MAG TPA: 16S rRNA (guanine(527)-N(7))-methyltransferase RsmG [Terriglobales bacterium]|nr:16S rRNA (guanine(527)-N(7))-methyltransferase RsmG [Terriglobales bacterium]